MKISTKRKRGCRTREREREMININVKEYAKMTMRLTTSVEPIWFEIMRCASFYRNFRSIPEVSRMF